MTSAAYDAIAEWYDTWIGPDALVNDPYYPAAETLMGEVAGRHVLDLACGQGRVARHLAERGARVVGVDLSAKLLAIARRHEAEAPRGIAYLRADARDLAGVADGMFDGVLCFLALMDIAELEPTLGSVARVLRPGGWFVFAILHPCFHTARSGEMETPEGMVRTVGRYFEEGHWRAESRSGPPGKVGAYHRTLATYVNALADAGLALERLAEPHPTSAVGADAQAPAFEVRPVWREVPAVLVARARRSSQ